MLLPLLIRFEEINFFASSFVGSGKTDVVKNDVLISDSIHEFLDR